MICDTITAYCARCEQYRKHSVNLHAIAVCQTCRTRRPADGSAPTHVPIPTAQRGESNGLPYGRLAC
jgi:hypothetical protein